MQSIQIELWQLVTAMAGLASAFACTVWAMSGLLLKQIDQRLDERFQAMEAARQESSRHWDERFAERLSELLSDNSSAPLQESLGRARFTAHLLGRLAGQP